MHDLLGPGTTLGYCTNVHAGQTLDAIKVNLERHALAVKRRVSPEASMGVGLWLPASAARALRQGSQAVAFADWLSTRGLLPFTINGFPYGDFHAAVVKHDVYHPNWTQAARQEYTIDLVHVLAALLPPGTEGSISTLPIGWRGDVESAEDLDAAGERLRAAARAAAAVEAETGTLIHIDLEPEPGCRLDHAETVVNFFERHLLGPEDEIVRRHVRVCHDVCHAAVMFEDQHAAFARYRDAGIGIGKIQVSSAVRVDFDALPAAHQEDTRQRLAAFAEDRYLHQTTIRDGQGRVAFHDDLPAALASDVGGGEWRVHFHVPIFLERAGVIGTTRDHIDTCLELLRADSAIHHVEVETYAWEVLPEPLRTGLLAEGIAREIEWLAAQGASGHATMTTRDTLRTGLELARVSNLPTCVTNVMVGCVIGSLADGDAGFPWTGFAVLAVAVGLLYVGGMILNDAVDARIDATERPGRPIPSGRVTRGAAFMIAATALVAGVGLVAPFGVGAMTLAIVLAATIVLYDVVHERTATSIVLMGACRGLVYVMSAIAISSAPDWPVLLATAAAMTVYIAIVTALARGESRAHGSRSSAHLLLPVVPLLVAVIVPPTHPDRAVAVGLAVVLWLGRSSWLMRSEPPRTRDAIMGWLAGICLIDAYTLTLLDQRALAMLAAVMFFITWLGHRRVSGT